MGGGPFETLEAGLRELREENQPLRDEIARLMGQKGKPHFQANRPATDILSKPSQSDPPLAAPRTRAKPLIATVPRAERSETRRRISCGSFKG